jgi:hypothetical protein
MLSPLGGAAVVCLPAVVEEGVTVVSLPPSPPPSPPPPSPFRYCSFSPTAVVEGSDVIVNLFRVGPKSRHGKRHLVDTY